ncbi:triacylglycerol lipase [Caenimonas koreensis]|uniref:Alpha/beta fold hydrolase n=1 Tax=Caenimonas koreensis DSM 17982 TaxID=1121255 RepID=A0A844AY85_9BURK|nr:alpha/beta fold hydrolase [Caenimonas koreensis]MRD49510.1 alpha/beta fold hydrolase [Caenimonas koreensis DSM 17982]
MQSHSALARLQQVVTVTLAALSLGWFAWHWNASPGIAVAGFVLIAFSYAAFLAVEFVALHFVGGDPQARPGALDLIRAWVGEVISAPRVFCWRQPFRWRAVPDFLGPVDGGRRGAVFIHGFVCNRGFWNPWLDRLRAAGHPFVAVNLEPVFGSIDEYVPIIEDAVERVTRATGMPPVLICHSMGGLAARAWLRVAKDHRRVHRVVTIGSPHNGTWLGRFSHLTNGREMRLDGKWVRELAKAANSQSHALFTCWYSNCDNIVFPVSTATLPGADNRLVRGVAHVDLAFDRLVVEETLAFVLAPSGDVNFSQE